jgi:hypothetical protein
VTILDRLTQVCKRLLFVTLTNEQIP